MFTQFRLARSYATSCFRGGPETSGEAHIKKCRMRLRNSSLHLRALAQWEYNGTVLWYEALPQSTERSFDISDAIPTTVVSPSMYAPKWVCGFGFAPPVMLLQLISPVDEEFHHMVSSHGWRQPSAPYKNTKSSFWRLTVYCNISFLHSTHKLWHVFSPHNLTCCDQQFGLPICARQGPLAQLIWAIT